LLSAESACSNNCDGLLLEFVPPVAFASVGVVVAEPAPPVVTSMLSMEMAVIVMSVGGTEVSWVLETLPVWFVPAAVLDGVVLGEVMLGEVVLEGLELDVDPVLVAAVSVAPVPVAPVPPVVVEAPVVPPSRAWSTL
jgi:hypothetical protein